MWRKFPGEMGTNQTAVHSQLNEVAQGMTEDYWKGQKKKVKILVLLQTVHKYISI